MCKWRIGKAFVHRFIKNVTLNYPTITLLAYHPSIDSLILLLIKMLLDVYVLSASWWLPGPSSG
jgi:hypothetical protein